MRLYAYPYIYLPILITGGTILVVYAILAITGNAESLAMALIGIDFGHHSLSQFFWLKKNQVLLEKDATTAASCFWTKSQSLKLHKFTRTFSQISTLKIFRPFQKNTPPKFNISGWQTTFLLGFGNFSGANC